MTVYNATLDTQIDPDAPATSLLMYQMRDNPIAMAEGAVGAPRIQGYAIASDNNGLLPVAVTAADTVTLTVGMSPVVGSVLTNSATYVLGYSYTVNSYTGTVRFKCSHQSLGGATSTLQFRKNGVAVSTFTTTAKAARVIDSTVALGDTFQWWHSHDFSGNDSSLTDISANASDGYVTRPVYWLASQS